MIFLDHSLANMLMQHVTPVKDSWNM